MALPPELTRKLEQQLRARAEALRGAIHEALLDSDGKDYGELAGRVLDVAELSVADMLADAEIQTLEGEVTELGEVEDALARIRGGRYGICAACEEEIDPRRLEAFPTARRCTACQTRADRQGRDRSPSL